jgi:hypothetical protein
MYKQNVFCIYWKVLRGGAVGWGAVLQAGRSRVRFPVVSLEFSIDMLLGLFSL